MLESRPTEPWSPSASSVPSASGSSVPASLESPDIWNKLRRGELGLAIAEGEGFSLCGDPREGLEFHGDNASWLNGGCTIPDSGAEFVEEKCVANDDMVGGGAVPVSEGTDGEEDDDEVSVTEDGVDELELPGEGME
jgi:hypothetical protein